MTEHLVVRENAWWKFRLGFGKLQKARLIIWEGLPDKLKRARVADPGMAPEKVAGTLTYEEQLKYLADTSIAVVRLVLDDAHDWNKGTTTVDQYVDSLMPEDVALEIYEAVQKRLMEGLTDESKKN